MFVTYFACLLQWLLGIDIFVRTLLVPSLCIHFQSVTMSAHVRVADCFGSGSLLGIGDSSVGVVQRDPVSSWLHHLLIEMLARTIKAEVRQAMRLQSGTGEYTFLKVVSDKLNHFLSPEPITDVGSWAQRDRAKKARDEYFERWHALLQHMQSKFAFTVQTGFGVKIDSAAFHFLPSATHQNRKAGSLNSDIARLFDLRSSHDSFLRKLDRRILFLRLQQLLNAQFTTNVWRSRYHRYLSTHLSSFALILIYAIISSETNLRSGCLPPTRHSYRPT
jgi:hypothetical protein